jgi:Flp pilus assembly protein TadG
VEFALVVPLLLVLLVGIIEFGRAWNCHQVITDAAREGARWSVIADQAITQPDVENRIRQYIAASGFNDSLAVISFPDGFKTGSNNVTAVRVEFPYRFVFLKALINLAFTTANGTVTLATEARMRNE